MPDCDVSITGKVQTAAAFASHQPESPPASSRIGASGCLGLLHAYHRAMNTEEAADVLRNLIQTLGDGKEGFRLAADAIDNSDLKKLFTHYSEQRAQFAMDLHKLSNGFGDPADNGNGPLEGTLRPFHPIRSTHRPSRIRRNKPVRAERKSSHPFSNCPNSRRWARMRALPHLPPSSSQRRISLRSRTMRE